MKIGTVPYINGLPLTKYLTGDIVELVPYELSKALLNEQVDVALLPVYTIIKNNLRMHPDAGIIGCEGPVSSVGFYTRYYIEDLGQIKSIYMDKESLSSIYLAKIILKKYYNISLYDLEFFHHDKREMADAQLLIGDKALFFDKKAPYRFWDIGEVWQQHTGTGFMFACWASKNPLSPAEVKILKSSKDIGLKNLQKIVADCQPSERERVLNYLSNHIKYESTPAIKEGLKLYKKYLDEFSYSKPLENVA